MKEVLNIQITINWNYWLQKLRSEPLQWNFANLTTLNVEQRADLTFSLDNDTLEHIKSKYAKSNLAFFTFSLSTFQKNKIAADSFLTNYWRNKLNGQIKTIDFSEVKKRPNTKTFNNAFYRFADELKCLAQKIPQQLNKKLIELRLINNNFVSEEDNSDTTETPFEFNF